MAFDGDILCVRPDVNGSGRMSPFLQELENRKAAAAAAREVLRAKLNDIKNVRDLPGIQPIVGQDTTVLAEAILELMKMFGVD